MATVGAVTSGLTATVKTAAYQSLPNDLVLANATTAAFTVTLPASPIVGTTVAVKKTDTSANVVTVVGYASSTIDGDPSALLASQDSAATFTFDGANWQVSSTAVLNVSSASASSSSRKIVGSVGSTATGPSTGGSETVVLTIASVIFQTGKAYSIRMGGHVYSGSDALSFYFKVRQTNATGTLIGSYGQGYYNRGSGGDFWMGAFGEAIVVRTAASNLTVPVVLTMVSSIASMTAVADASRPRWLLVEELGAATDYSWALAIA